MAFRNFFILLSSSILLFLSACSHYKLGRSAELPFKSIYVQPAKNHTFVPQAQAILSQQVAERLMRDGHLKLTGKEDADTTLIITLSDYDRDVSATQAGDTRLAQSFNLHLQAQVTLINNKTGNAYFENRAVETDQHAFIDGGFQPSEFQALPVVTERLAQQISDVVTSVW